MANRVVPVMEPVGPSPRLQEPVPPGGIPETPHDPPPRTVSRAGPSNGEGTPRQTPRQQDNVTANGNGNGNGGSSGAVAVRVSPRPSPSMNMADISRLPRDSSSGGTPAAFEKSAAAMAGPEGHPIRVDSKTVHSQRYAMRDPNLPYEEPSLEKAQMTREEAMFRGGKAKLFGKGIQDLGNGIILYFGLLRYLALLMGFFSLLSLPGLMLAGSGHHISPEAMDSMNLGRLALGNIGYFDDGRNPNETATTVPIFNGEMQATDASLLIMLYDVGICLSYIVFILFFRQRIASVTKQVDDESITLADYAVFVKGLPADATKSEVVAHFSKLYDLREDWTFPGFRMCKCAGRKLKARLPVADVQPVSNPPNTGDDLYCGSWIAECELAYKNGGMLKRYLSAQSVQTKLYLAAANASRFRQDSKYADAQKYEKLQGKVAKLRERLDKLQNKKAGIRTSSSVVGAYVTFEHTQSQIRCLYDYRRSHSMWGRYVQPPPLRFRGIHPLRVSRAPPPSDVKWENLEFSPVQRVFRVLFTSFLVLILLTISFALLVAANKSKSEVQGGIPSPTVCNLEIPAYLYGTYDFPESVVLKRNRTCTGGTVGIYIVDAEDEAAGPPPVDARLPCTDPCLDPADTCEYLSSAKKTFVAKDIGSCYCVAQLRDQIKLKGLIDGAKAVSDVDGDLCLRVAGLMVQSNALLIVSVLVVVVVNTLLKAVMRQLALFERHDSASEETSAMAVKLFFTQAMNTGLTALIVNGQIPTDAARRNFLAQFGVFGGLYSGFTTPWYATVGVSLTLTMILQAFVPHVAPILLTVVVAPLKRCLCRRRAATQMELDALYAPATFQLVDRYPVLLTCLFVCFTYSAGLPLMMPIAAASFAISFFVDRWILIRYSAKPPAYNESLAVNTARLLPVALIMHMCFAIWMYGENTILKSKNISASLVVGSAGDDIDAEYAALRARTDATDKLGLTAVLVRVNVFPIFVLLCIVLASFTVLRVAFQPLVMGFLWMLRCVTRGRCGAVQDRVESLMDQSDSGSGGFTNDLRVPVSIPRLTRQKDENQAVFNARVHQATEDLLTEEEAALGWQMTKVVNEEGTLQAAYLFKTWDKDGIWHGCPHSAGDRKKVWEHVAEAGLHTYAMAANPTYRGAALELHATHAEQSKAEVEAKPEP